ncbi:MAG: hypothetical protein KGL39_24090 [Patescibacteria group bacterium]|nr:hypothetical protein [Patescibacteria group bacterium]
MRFFDPLRNCPIFSTTLLTRALELLPPGPPGCRPRDVREGLAAYSTATVQNAISYLAREGLAACSGPIGARRYWRCPETHRMRGGHISDN